MQAVSHLFKQHSWCHYFSVNYTAPQSCGGACLCCAAALIAFLCNAGRALLLAAVGAKEGIDSIANWHDPLGYAILTICFLLIWGMARLIAVPVPLPRLVPTAAIALSRSPHRLIFGLGVWILFTVIGTEVWYRGHETPEKRPWSVVWPVHKKEFVDIPISKLEADKLSFNEGRGVEWTNGDGSHWIGYFFTWKGGNVSLKPCSRAPP